jgi:acyl carrier protein
LKMLRFLIHGDYSVANARFPLAAQHGAVVYRNPAMHGQDIRTLIAAHARLPVDVNELAEDACLYDAGLTSLSTVNLMLALEDHFDVEFPDRMLGRKTFGTIRSLSEAIEQLRGPAAPPAAVPLENRDAA